MGGRRGPCAVSFFVILVGDQTSGKCCKSISLGGVWIWPCLCSTRFVTSQRCSGYGPRLRKPCGALSHILMLHSFEKLYCVETMSSLPYRLLLVWDWFETHLVVKGRELSV